LHSYYPQQQDDQYNQKYQSNQSATIHVVHENHSNVYYDIMVFKDYVLRLDMQSPEGLIYILTAGAWERGIES
jgi:hypothetical protein